MRSIQSIPAPRGAVLTIALGIAGLGALEPAAAEDVKIVTGEVSAEELADMLFVEQPRTRSICSSEITRGTRSGSGK